jgi:ATP-dependent RNA helicase SUPV3L1/SUV3
VVAPEIGKRAERLAGAPNEEFVLSTDGCVRWRGEVVANLSEGDTLLAPRLIVLADESLTGPLLERVQDRLNLWLRHYINTHLDAVVQLMEPPELEGTARGIAYQLGEHLGIMPRAAVAEEVKGLDQDVRAKMRKLGIKFGAYHIYVPASLKPAPRELAVILHALKHGGVRQPGVTELPQIVLSGRTSFVIDPEVDTKLYEVAGFKVAGKRAVRVDILERLADIIRPLIALDADKPYAGDLPKGAGPGNGFRVTVEMTSLLGTAGEDFASILTSLGYRVRRVPKADAPLETVSATEAGAIPEQSSAAPDTADAGEAPPVGPAAEAVEQVAEAAINELATEAVEGAAAEPPPEHTPQAESAAVVTATADLGASAPPPEEKPEEPQYDEIWYPAGRNPRAPRHRAGQPAPHLREGAQVGEAEGADGAKRHRRRDGGRRPQAEERPPQEAGRANGKGKPNEGKGARKERGPAPRPPRREPTYDPDSPFAALAVLRQPKSE